MTAGRLDKYSGSLAPDAGMWYNLRRKRGMKALKILVKI